MPTFVSEQVKKLDRSLTQSFETNLEGTKAVSFTSLSEKDQFLYKAIQALDLSSDNLPTFDKVKEYLEKYQENFNNHSSLNTASTTDELEWFFVAKCTIAIYGQVFSKVLELTLPISESIDYWNDIQGSTLQEIYYGLQSKYL
jgi:nuclear-control-of-ATPase protein 2